MEKKKSNAFSQKLPLLLKYLPTVLIILLGTVGLTGIFGDNVHNDIIMLALLTLIAGQLFMDRITGLNKLLRKQNTLSETIENLKCPYSGNYIELRNRQKDIENGKFEPIQSFAKGAKEILIAGIDLGFFANAGTTFFLEELKRNESVLFKILLVSPDANGIYSEMINNHDERNSKKKIIHEHIDSAADTIQMLKDIHEKAGKGHLIIKARVDIPNPTFAMVDAEEERGKMRFELKPYKGNRKDVGYFCLDRKSDWYDVYYDRYYKKLWEDSVQLYPVENKIADANKK